MGGPAGPREGERGGRLAGVSIHTECITPTMNPEMVGTCSPIISIFMHKRMQRGPSLKGDWCESEGPKGPVREGCVNTDKRNITSAIIMIDVVCGPTTNHLAKHAQQTDVP